MKDLLFKIKNLNVKFGKIIPSIYTMMIMSVLLLSSCEGMDVLFNDEIDNTIPVKSISLQPTLELLTDDPTFQLIPEIFPLGATNKNVQWSSDDISIAIVAEDGTVTPVGAGTTNINAQTEDGGFIARCVVTVDVPVVPVQGVMITESIVDLSLGETKKLVAAIGPADATNKNVNWSSGDETIATVAPDGAVTAVDPGVTFIRVTTVDGNFLDTCQVTVSATHCVGDYMVTNEDEMYRIRNCEVITGSLEVRGLVDLDSLGNLTTVNGDLTIFHMNAIEHLDGLSNIDTVGGDLTIENNRKLLNIDGLNNLTTVGGNVKILDNEVLTIQVIETFMSNNKSKFNNEIELAFVLCEVKDILEYSSYSTIKGSLIIRDSYYRGGGDNYKMKDLDGLSNLKSIEGDLDIRNNFYMTGLLGLNNLTTVGGNLKIFGNEKLENLDSISNLTSVNGNVNVYNNDVLPTCEADNFIDQLIGFSGATSIYGNNGIGTCD